MRKLVLISFLSLDGVMQSPGAKGEDSEGGFRYGGWQIPYFEDVDEAMANQLQNTDALLLGRKTYDIFASYWPNEGKKVEGFGDFMNSITKYVASHTLSKTEWENSNLLKGDVAEAVDKIKNTHGKDIIMYGSGNLAQTLMHHRLIDEYLLLVHPLVLGEGKRLFEPGSYRQDLELIKSKTTKNGVLSLTYKLK